MDQYKGYRHPFVDGSQFLGGCGDIPRTLTELAMSQLSAELRSRKNWWIESQDPSIRANWAANAANRVWKVRVPSKMMDVILSTKQIEYIIGELSGYAALRDGGCQISCFERIWERDCSDLALSLESSLEPVRQASASRRRRSENGVTKALVDPFLYPLVYNTTLIRGTIPHLHTEPPPSHFNPTVLSAKYAFLPTNYHISSSGKATPTSYINNIAPYHEETYKTLTDVLTSSIPLFEHVLTDLHRNNPLHQRIKGSCNYTEWEEPDAPVHSDDEEGWVSYEREMQVWIESRPIQLPDVPKEGYVGGLEKRKLEISLKGRTVQVIIGIHDICLEPGGPSEYQGTPWHIEGMINERIVACAMLCTSSDNISTNTLHFRMAVTSPRGISAGDTGAALRTWGLLDGDPCHQRLGSVPIRPGLFIAWPNIYQHRHSPFTLADSTRPGRQTLVSISLVDPDIQPIIYTGSVAPQQKEWIRRAVDESLDPSIPEELVEVIMEGVEGLMDESIAETYREEMVKEREAFRKLNDAQHFSVPFDIWNEMV